MDINTYAADFMENIVSASLTIGSTAVGLALIIAGVTVIIRIVKATGRVR